MDVASSPATPPAQALVVRAGLHQDSLPRGAVRYLKFEALGVELGRVYLRVNGRRIKPDLRHAQRLGRKMLDQARRTGSTSIFFETNSEEVSKYLARILAH